MRRRSVIVVGGRDLVPAAEQPNDFQLIFAEDRVRALASRHPQCNTLEPFKWVLEGNRDALAAMGEKGMMQIIAETHAGLNTEEFRNEVLNWIASARHPRFKRPHTELVYQPMLELLDFLRANQFKTFIVSSTTARASPRVSTALSAVGRCFPSGIRTAISRCWNGPRAAPARASWRWCTTPTQCAHTKPCGSSSRRCLDFAQNAAPRDWDGVWRFDRK